MGALAVTNHERVALSSKAWHSVFKCVDGTPAAAIRLKDGHLSFDQRHSNIVVNGDRLFMQQQKDSWSTPVLRMDLAIVIVTKPCSVEERESDDETDSKRHCLPVAAVSPSAHESTPAFVGPREKVSTFEACPTSSRDLVALV